VSGGTQDCDLLSVRVQDLPLHYSRTLEGEALEMGWPLPLGHTGCQPCTSTGPAYGPCPSLVRC
jgi:hypothetical protein